MSEARVSILFVCLGNICRSPTAEAIFQSIVARENLQDRFDIESAGTAGYHIGEYPDPRTQKHGEKRGYEFVTKARKFSAPKDFKRFDYIVAMGDDHFETLQALDASGTYESKLHRMVDYAKNHDVDEVPDPYYGGSKDFEDVLDILEDACEGLFEYIKEKEGL